MFLPIIVDIAHTQDLFISKLCQAESGRFPPVVIRGVNQLLTLRLLQKAFLKSSTSLTPGAQPIIGADLMHRIGLCLAGTLHLQVQCILSYLCKSILLIVWIVGFLDDLLDSFYASLNGVCSGY